MITEDYVSVETAKLLNIKGFKGEFHKHYWGYEPGKEFLTDSSFNPEYDYPAPTLQTAMKWLREKYKLHIITLPYAPFDRRSYHPGFEADMVYIAQLFRGIIPIDEIGRSVIKLTHEEACEAAIKYCLENLI